MESDYQSLFQVRLANYDDIPAIMNITREAFVKYQQMSGVENLAALEESYNDVKKDIDTKVVLLALSDGEPVGSVRVEVFPDKTAYLSRFAVKVTSQNNGIGKSIMNLVDKIMVKKECNSNSVAYRLKDYIAYSFLLRQRIFMVLIRQISREVMFAHC